MLKVRTRITSAFRGDTFIGLGLMADQDIPKDTVIWKYCDVLDKTIHVSDVESLDDISKEFLKTYAYREGSKVIICTDNGRYVNHSYEPNTKDFIDDNGDSLTVASRHIYVGEEITSDYRSFDDDSKDGRLKDYF